MVRSLEKYINYAGILVVVFFVINTQYSTLSADRISSLRVQSQKMMLERKKYIVGCNPSGWKSYVRPEYFHLYTALIKNYGWEVLDIDNTTSTFLLKNPAPLVMYFCENHVEKIVQLPVIDLQLKGTKMAMFTDDTQYYRRYKKDEMRALLITMDVLVSSYAYRLKNFFRDVDVQEKDFPALLWNPHSAGPEFLAGSFNDKPVREIFLSGAVGNGAYPLRAWLHDHFHTKHPNFMAYRPHPGYGKVAANQTEIYATKLRSYFCGVTTTLIHRRVIAKIMEIPATGSLLLVNTDLEPQLEALGLYNMKHYVGFDGNDPEPMLWWVLNPENFGIVDKIRYDGMQIVRQNHKTADRAKALDDYFTTGKVTYNLVPMATESPCPMKGYDTEKACLLKFQEKSDKYYPGRAKLQPHPYITT